MTSQTHMRREVNEIPEVVSRFLVEAAPTLDAAAARLGGEQHVNTFTTADQVLPAVSPLGGGAFVVAWSSGCFYGTPECGPDGSGSSVALQRFDASGTPAGTEMTPGEASSAYGFTQKSARMRASQSRLKRPSQRKRAPSSLRARRPSI